MSEKRALNTIIESINKSIGEKDIILFYPVYVNTFALAHLLESQKLRIKCEIFNWNAIVPERLTEILEKKDSPDIIYCFSSSDNENIFRRRVEEIISNKSLPYNLSKPGSVSILPPEHETGIETDIDYSNYAIKYLFFEVKINIERIHALGVMFFECEETDNPYLTNLLSILLARGYQTIQLKTEIQDESKGLVRKLLHEDFGFKFRLIPKAHEYKINNTLTVETKGGQQSFEEIQRQNDGESFKKTFVIPNSLKYTSQTKLIAIYKNHMDIDERIKEKREAKTIRDDIAELSLEHIFNKKSNNKTFDENVVDDFIIKNIKSVIEGIKYPDGYYSDEKFKKFQESNPFLKSLQLYIDHIRIKSIISRSIESGEELWKDSKFITAIKTEAQSLKMPKKADFILCLNDHHIDNKENKRLEWPSEFQTHSKNYIAFCNNVISYYTDFEENLRPLKNGLFLLMLILMNPNGVPDDEIETEAKEKEYIDKKLAEKEEFFTNVTNKENVFTENIIKYYSSLRIIAEDINYLIVEERLLCDPKIIFKILPGFDLTEFEYLYSVDFFEKLYHNKTKPVS